MGMLTEHFSAEELGVDKYPEKKEQARLFCQYILETLRIKLGPLIIHDGYRPADHNKEVGGVANSFHLFDEDKAACDFTPENYNIRQAFDYIRLGSGLNFDKVILELDKKTLVPKNIHIQYYTKILKNNRRQAFEGYTFGEGFYTEVAVI